MYVNILLSSYLIITSCTIVKETGEMFTYTGTISTCHMIICISYFNCIISVVEICRRSNYAQYESELTLIELILIDLILICLITEYFK